MSKSAVCRGVHGVPGSVLPRPSGGPVGASGWVELVDVRIDWHGVFLRLWVCFAVNWEWVESPDVTRAGDGRALGP